jgi:hypothetical protein
MVREAFWAMMNTGVLDDLEAVTGFISQAQYPKLCGVSKSSLIDLEALWGDKAQAEQFALAA